MLRYDHSAIIEDKYLLESGAAIGVGDVVEFTSEPPTMVRGSVGEQWCYEVRRGCENSEVLVLGGTGPDDAIGFSFSRILATSINRYVSTIVHGFALARACAAGDIVANEPVKCCSIGEIQTLNRTGLTAIEVANFILARAIDNISAGRIGLVFRGI